MDEGMLGGPVDFLRRGGFGEIERHQWLEISIVIQRGHNQVAVGHGLLDGGDRRFEIRHDDGARKLASRVGHHRSQHGTVAHVEMPVIRTGEGQLLRIFHLMLSYKCTF